MATIHQKFTGDAAQLEKEIEKLRRDYIKLQEQMGRNTAAAKKSAEQAEQSSKSVSRFATTAVQNVASMAAGWLSVSAGISAATKALADYQQQEERGRNETDKLAEARKQLLQVSQGDFKELEKRADAASVRFGIDRVTSRNLLFTARSEGFEADFEKVAALNPITNPESAARIAGQVRTMFDKENLDTMSVINAVLKGARDSRLNIDQLTAALPQAGEGGRQQGATLDETVAASAVLASVFKSGETAGDRLKMLMSKMATNQTTAGRGLLGGLDAIQSMSRQDREKFLGDSTELRAAYAAATDMEDRIRAQTAAVRESRVSATGTNRLLQEYYSDPTLLQSTLTRGQAAAADIASENRLSEDANQFQAFRDFVNRRMTDENWSSISRFGVNRGLDAMWMRYGSDVDNTTIGRTAIGQQFLEEQKRQTEELIKSLSNIDNNTRRSAQIPSAAQRNVHQEAD